jgi:hypothetical protein
MAEEYTTGSSVSRQVWAIICNRKLGNVSLTCIVEIWRKMWFLFPIAFSGKGGYCCHPVLPSIRSSVNNWWWLLTNLFLLYICDSILHLQTMISPLVTYVKSECRNNLVIFHFSYYYYSRVLTNSLNFDCFIKQLAFFNFRGRSSVTQPIRWLH